MLFQFNLYSSLLLVFFVHILVYGGMFWWRGCKQESVADRLLGSFLVVAALYVVPWMTGFAGWYHQEYPAYRDFLFYMPFVHGLLFGPLLYLYIKCITNFNYRVQKNEMLHFLPGALYLLWCIVVVVTDRVVLKKYYLMNGDSDPDFSPWYTWLQRISIIIYLYASLRYYRQYKQFTRYELSFADMAGMNWLRNFLIAFGLLTLLPVAEFVLSRFSFFQNLNYRGSWITFMAFALVVYYIAINGYHVVYIPLQRLAFKPALLLQYQQPRQLSASLSTTEDADFEIISVKQNEAFAIADTALKKRLLAYIENEKPHLDATITLSALAKKLDTNASVLSRVINTGTQQNFNDFINGYRIQEVVKKLKAGEHRLQTLLGIAFDCGFNSKATFNRAFKKANGLSPKEFAEKL
jgi:AraC-like DNA-binding protein